MSLFRSVTHPAFQSKDQQQVFMMEIMKLLQMINRGTKIEEILQGIFDNFGEILPYDRIGFAIINEQEYTVEAVWTQSRYTQIKLGGGYSTSLKKSSLEHIIQTGQPRIINDLLKYFKDHPNSEATKLMLDEGIRSSLTCPIIHGDNPVGFIFFSSKQTDIYKEHHIDAFNWLTEPLALALERAQMYESLVKLNQEKNMLLGVASHDLRSPIAQIQTMGELLQGELTVTERKELGGLLTQRCQYLLRMLNDLLDISAIDAGRMQLKVENTQIKLLTHSVVQTLLPMANAKHIGINVFIENDFKVRVDPHRFNQVIDNLVTNSIKYSEENTTITITAKEENDEWMLIVTDQGQGIPADELHKLFEAFSKTTSTPTGGEKQFGLGLAIVKKIVQAHNGTVNVESQEGKGTSFIIKMPNIA